MAVAIRFITIVVRRDAIEEKFKGGWERWLDIHERKLGKICWHDESLFAISWMNGQDIDTQLQEYEDSGLIHFSRDAADHLKCEDMCVVEMTGFPSNCEWLEIIEDDNLFGISGVKLTGDTTGKISGPDW